MEALPLLNIIGGILLYIGKFLILIAVIIAVYKIRNTGSILMLAGALAIVIGDVAGMALLLNAGRSGNIEVVKITGVNSIIAALTHLLFAIGIMVFMLQVVRRKTMAAAIDP